MAQADALTPSGGSSGCITIFDTSPYPHFASVSISNGQFKNCVSTRPSDPHSDGVHGGGIDFDGPPHEGVPNKLILTDVSFDACISDGDFDSMVSTGPHAHAKRLTATLLYPPPPPTAPLLRATSARHPTPEWARRAPDT